MGMPLLRIRRVLLGRPGVPVRVRVRLLLRRRDVRGMLGRRSGSGLGGGTAPGRGLMSRAGMVGASGAVRRRAVLARGREVEVLDGGQTDGVAHGGRERVGGVLRRVRGGHGSGGNGRPSGREGGVYLLYLPINPDLVRIGAG